MEENIKADTVPFSERPLRQRMDWPTTLFLVITPLLMFTLVPLHIYNVGWDWRLLVFFLVYSAATTLSIGSGYHRFFAHKAYETNNFMKFVYLFLASAQFQGPAIKWASDHRRHHKFVDTDADPYSIKKGFFYAHIGWLFMKEDPQNRAEFEKDLLRDPLVMWQYKYYVPLASFTAFLLPMGVGALMGSPWGGLIYAGLARVVFTQHSTFFVNSLAHTWGRRPFDSGNSARDSFLVSVFTFGEGYHNYHHKFQADYRNGIRWFDWDPSKWLIRTLGYLGLAKQLKRSPPSEIMKARLQTQGQVLLSRGVPAEKIESLRARVHSAQQTWRKMRDEYQAMKANWNSQDQILRMKAELKMAKLEFKMAYRQWKAYYKILRA